MTLGTTNQTNCTNKTPVNSGKEKIVFREESFRLVGACFEVYNNLGCGFLEPVYQESLVLELRDQAIPFLDQQALQLRYKTFLLETSYKSDFVCYGKIILEIKAVSRLTDEHRAQVHNYLKATGYKLGILVNFGQYPSLIYERIVR